MEKTIIWAVLSVRSLSYLTVTRLHSETEFRGGVECLRTEHLKQWGVRAGDSPADGTVIGR